MFGGQKLFITAGSISLENSPNIILIISARIFLFESGDVNPRLSVRTTDNVLAGLAPAYFRFDIFN